MSAGQPLTVAVEDGRLVVSIGIDTLMTTLRACDWWAEVEAELADEQAFLDAIVAELRRDDFEDGQPLAFVAFSMAAETAAEDEDCPGLIREEDDLQ